MPASLTATACCLGCDWAAQGKPPAVDKAAGKHTAPGHATVTESRPGGTAAGDSVSGD